MSKIILRINGIGNAWPVILGQDHPFYDRSNIEYLANASCSLIKSKANTPGAKEIEWELMIDSGHGAVQYLLKNCNRIPETIFLTHPHIDHTLGLDWIVQSYYRTYHKPYPVYATALCWEKVKETFPHLIDLVIFKELIPYQQKIIQEADDVVVTPYPVYHGKNAKGATMLLFEIKESGKEKKVLFTGDILCPLLREQDYATLRKVDLLVTDANNRYPYPKSNHWSVVEGLDSEESRILSDFIREIQVSDLLFPHMSNVSKWHNYFNEDYNVSGFCFSIESFVKAILPGKVILLHYSGVEDFIYYNQKTLSFSELGNWIQKLRQKLNLSSQFIVAYVSQHIEL